MLFKSSYPRLLLKGNCRVKQKRQWTVCLPVDIPTGWEPRAKQQPTGLIAYGAARRRPAGLWLPASASCLGRRSRLAGHGPNNDSLFLPQAAVVIVAIPRTGQIKNPLHIVQRIFMTRTGIEPMLQP